MHDDRLEKCIQQDKQKESNVINSKKTSPEVKMEITTA